MTVDLSAPTFFFTDIAGSTARWEQHPDEMRTALASHDALLRDAVARYGGRVFKHTGDGVGVVFAGPAQAVAAAAAAQRSLRDHDWSAVGGLRVRMAIHVGPAYERDGDFFGRPLNRVARLLDATHGGQILVSGTAAGAIAGNDLEDVACSLLRLGDFRLRDLDRPVEIFQVRGRDLDDDFPELRTLEAVPHNLPVQLSTFVGRAEALVEVGVLLAGSRLVTLTGVGGVGKTRLALQAAAVEVPRYPDGVWLVDLAPITDPDRLIEVVAAALGVAEDPSRSLDSLVERFLMERRILLILDNCEHLIDVAAKFVDHSLRACAELKVLATSREALGVAGEAVLRVPSLALPTTSEEATYAPAVELFRDRARLAAPDAAIAPDDLPAVVQICRRLDGIPLAIELAAARLTAMSIDQVAARLDDRFRLLTGGSRTALPRQRTLAATMDWSHDLLPDQEQVLLRRLAVFSGGCTLGAVEAVTAADPLREEDVLDLLAHLVDVSLLVYDEDEVRYQSLETVRQYALDRLLAAGEADETRLRHAVHFAGWEDRPLTSAVTTDEDRAWLDRVAADAGNFRAALAWSLDADRWDLMIELSTVIMPFWWRRGFHGEARSWIGRITRRADRLPPSAALAGLLGWMSALALLAGETDEAAELAHREQAMAVQLGDLVAMGRAESSLGMLHANLGEVGRTVDHHREAARLLEEAGDPRAATSIANLAIALNTHGRLEEAAQLLPRLDRYGQTEGTVAIRSVIDGANAFHLGDLEGAAALLGSSRDYYAASGNAPVALSLDQALAWLAVLQGDVTGARSASDRLMATAAEMGSAAAEAEGHHILAAAALAEGDAAGAARSIERALDLEPAPEDANWYSQGMLAVAEVALLAGDAGGAAVLFGRARDSEQGAAAPRPRPFDEAARELWTRIQEALGDDEAVRRRTEGGALGEAESMALVRRILAAT